MKINKSGEWKNYMQTAPQGAEVFGTVETESGTGALIRLKKRYYRVNDGILHVLDGRTVAGALGKLGTGGRPQSMENGRKIMVYLDDETVFRAKEMAGGNLSEGLRCAVWLATP